MDMYIYDLHLGIDFDEYSRTCNEMLVKHL